MYAVSSLKPSISNREYSEKMNTGGMDEYGKESACASMRRRRRKIGREKGGTEEGPKSPVTSQTCRASTATQRSSRPA